MYRNFGTNRSRNWQNRSQHDNNSRDNERANFRDNRSRDDDSDREIWSRIEDSRRNGLGNTDSQSSSRFQDSSNFGNIRQVEEQSERTRFMTPINNFSVLEEIKSPVHQQFQNLFGQPILQNSSSVDNQQSNRNSVLNTQVAIVNNNTNREQ